MEAKKIYQVAFWGNPVHKFIAREAFKKHKPWAMSQKELLTSKHEDEAASSFTILCFLCYYSVTTNSVAIFREDSSLLVKTRMRQDARGDLIFSNGIGWSSHSKYIAAVGFMISASYSWFWNKAAVHQWLLPRSDSLLCPVSSQPHPRNHNTIMLVEAEKGGRGGLQWQLRVKGCG